MFSPVCDDDDHSPPSTHYLAQFGTRQGCGLITVEVTSEEFGEAFLRNACGGEDGPECAAVYSDMFFARLQERFTMADWQWVVNKCKAYPVECKSFERIELWAMESHNDQVLAWARAAVRNTNASYAAEYERAYLAEQERRRARAEAISAGVNAFLSAGQPSVRCTTNTLGSATGRTYGSTSTTTCR